MAGVAAIASVVVSAGSAAAANRNQRRASEAQNRAIQEGAAAADPAAHLRPQFQDELMARYPALSGVNYAEILNDPSFKFLKDQGETAAVNQASAAGLLRSGTLLEDLSTFNQNLSSTFIDKQFERNARMLGMLGNFSGLTSGSPGGAGSIIGTGGLNAAQFGYNATNNTYGNIGGMVSQIGRLFNNRSGSDVGSGYAYGGSAGNPGGNWDSPG